MPALWLKQMDFFFMRASQLLGSNRNSLIIKLLSTREYPPLLKPSIFAEKTARLMEERK